MSAREPVNVVHALPARREHYYGGAWHRSVSGAVIDVDDPATGASLGTASNGNAADVDHAVAAAADAFAAWRDTPAQDRARSIRAAAAILRAHRDDLAWVDALDTGNPLQAMRYDVDISAAYMQHFAGLVTEIKGSTIPIAPGLLNYTLREPLGVVARIGAFNHPLLFVAGKAGAPLAAGNTLVIKPADQTPLSALRIAELWQDVFPPGVFNVVTGGREAGSALASHPRVAKILVIVDNTGFSSTTDGVYGNCHFGMERDLLEANAPSVVKSPYICDYLDDVLRQGYVKVVHTLVPMCDLFAAAETRRDVQRTSKHAPGACVPGGLWSMSSPADPGSTTGRPVL